MQNQCLSASAGAVYTIGLDFGSLSCRGVLVDAHSGAIAAEAAFSYPHGVMDAALPDGTPLPPGWHVQHPSDYEGALHDIIPALMKKSGVSPKQVIAIGVDATASTVIAVDEAMRPLCLRREYASKIHAWPKMWKHHAAYAQAQTLMRVSEAQNRPYPSWYGGRISAECLMAKVLETFEEGRDVYEAAHAFIELADWIPSLLAGKPVFSTALASAKGFYDVKTGYPDAAFFAAIDPALAKMPQEKLMDRFARRTLAHPCQAAGALCPEMAQALGLCTETVICAGQMDAYTPLAALGVNQPGVMLMVLGTSTGIMLLSDTPRAVNGVTASLPDAFFPGMWGYASGQASVGDGLQWFAQHCVPGAYEQEAARQGISVQQYLTQLCAQMEPGETGLLCLDWLNGNRSCLANPQLSGMFLGLNLHTRPEHIYRAMLEATAFGARVIVEAYRTAGVPVREIRVCGGIAGKNPLMMQIYADVLGMPLQVSRCTQAPALGAAIYAAAAAGEKSGYADVFAAVNALSDPCFTVYTPDARRQAAYETLYGEYLALHDYFGRGGNDVMERLYRLRMKQG